MVAGDKNFLTKSMILKPQQEEVLRQMRYWSQTKVLCHQRHKYANSRHLRLSTYLCVAAEDTNPNPNLNQPNLTLNEVNPDECYHSGKAVLRWTAVYRRLG